MNKKRHIIISNYDDINNPVYQGGGAVVVHTLAKHLRKTYKVTVLTGTYHGAKEGKIDGVFYKRIGSNNFGPKLGQLLFQFLLPYYVNTLQFDVWIESFTPPFSTGFLQLYTKNPVIGVTHFINAEDKSKEYKLPFFILERLGLKTYRYIIALSEAIKDKIRKYNKYVTIEVIPNGITLPEKKYINQKSDSYGLYIGRIEIDQKGLDLLLQSFAKAKKVVNDRLIIAGTGSRSELNKLVTLVEKYDLVDSVDIVGRVVGREKENLIAKAKYILIPSRYENFSIVSLEALSFGKPIICFDIYGLLWIPNNITIKCPKYSVNSYSKAIQKLSTTPKLREELSINSFKFIKNYTWTEIFNKYDIFIASVINKKL